MLAKLDEVDLRILEKAINRLGTIDIYNVKDEKYTEKDNLISLLESYEYECERLEKIIEKLDEKLNEDYTEKRVEYEYGE